jgi:hypothetical protein
MEDHRLRVFEKRALSRIFGPKTDEVMEGWRKLHGLYSSPRLKWAGHVARMRKKRNVYRLLVGKPEGKRPLGRPKRRLVDNIKVDLEEIG